MPNSLGNIGLGLRLPCTSRSGQTPPAGLRQGVAGEPHSPLEAGAPLAPRRAPLLPRAFIPCANGVCQIRLHSWLCSTCLFSVPARRLGGGGGGGRAGVLVGETGAGCCFPSPYLFKA